ncbi:hypothetical protein CMV30_09355 [Nibricoccus aquaticus]|uniref:Uncharacterized protein n=1 Tax=Nibricoccus aquaticus TaxID=2576891 RepID=A0A290Q6L7_9BACT|nr:hypothetical protein CMV30_09355 [Nibricoccus aquaticus]
MSPLAFLMRYMSLETDARLSALGIAGFACLVISGLWVVVLKRKNKRSFPYMLRLFLGVGIAAIVTVIALRVALPSPPLEIATPK